MSSTFGYKGLKSHILCLFHCALFITSITFTVLYMIHGDNIDILRNCKRYTLSQLEGNQNISYNQKISLSQLQEPSQIIECNQNISLHQNISYNQSISNDHNASNLLPIISHHESCRLNERNYHNTISIKPKYSRSDIGARFSEPLYLYSEGGSGNTWTRILLEYITGISTGEPFGDKTTIRTFIQNGRCHNGLLLCKAHPCWFYDAAPGYFHLRSQGKWGKTKVKSHIADGLVWIVRNPWHSMWAMYQLIVGKYNSHIYQIQKKEFNLSHFHEFVWLGNTRISLVDHWKLQFVTADALKLNRSWTDDNIVKIQYEKLLSEETKVKEIMKVMQHLYILNNTNYTMNDTYFVYASKREGLKNVSYVQLQHRIECAFNYSRTVSRVHRNKSNPDYVSMHDAYIALGTRTICGMWNSLRSLAEPFGYKQILLDELNCDNMNISYQMSET